MAEASFEPDDAGFSGEPVEEFVYSSMMRGRVRRELLELVVGDDSKDLDKEKEVLRSIREGARERIGCQEI